MKITKRQLKRIIKEEKRKLLRESVTDMDQYETSASKAARDMSDMFYNDMMEMWYNEPEEMEARTGGDQDVWEQQVVYAQQEMDTSVQRAIENAVQEVEARLHNGEFLRDETTPRRGR